MPTVRSLFMAALTIGCLAFTNVASTQSAGYDTHFTDKTMRVDYFHSGGQGQDRVARPLVSDGPWLAAVRVGGRSNLAIPLRGR